MRKLITISCRLSDDQIAALEAIVGKANVSTDNYDRLSVAYGKTMVDLMRLRKHIVENVPDAVVYPKNREDIIALVKYCCEQKIPCMSTAAAPPSPAALKQSRAASRST